MATTSHAPTHTKQPPRGGPGLLAGFGIGVVWVILSGISLWSAVRGYANHRYDWGLAWLVVGILIGAAGIIAMVATWHHLTTSHDSH